jgi:hypothetical protein
MVLSFWRALSVKKEHLCLRLSDSLDALYKKCPNTSSYFNNPSDEIKPERQSPVTSKVCVMKKRYKKSLALVKLTKSHLKNLESAPRGCN